MSREQETEDRKQKIQTQRLQKGDDIAERLLQLAVNVVRLIRLMPRDCVGRHVSSQLMRSSTSSGANYGEARAAESRPDFIHKIGVAAKEMQETLFWLRLIQQSEPIKSDLSALIVEARELLAILLASRRTARSHGA